MLREVCVDDSANSFPSGIKQPGFQILLASPDYRLQLSLEDCEVSLFTTVRSVHDTDFFWKLPCGNALHWGCTSNVHNHGTCPHAEDHHLLQDWCLCRIHILHVEFSTKFARMCQVRIIQWQKEVRLVKTEFNYAENRRKMLELILNNPCLSGASQERSGDVHERFLQAAFTQVARNVNDFNLRSLANLVWALAVSGTHPEWLLHTISSAAARRMGKVFCQNTMPPF